MPSSVPLDKAKESAATAKWQRYEDAWALQDVSASVKLTHLALADLADHPDKPDGWLFYVTVAQRVGVVKASTVRANLETLYMQGLVQKQTIDGWIMFRLKERGFEQKHG